MTTTLSQQNIDLVENFLKTEKFLNQNRDIVPSISYKHYDLAEEYYNEITQPNVPINTYYLFASNAYGYTSYGFYKASNKKIYIIEAFMNEITNVYIPSSKFHCLKKFFDEMKSDETTNKAIETLNASELEILAQFIVK